MSETTSDQLVCPYCRLSIKRSASQRDHVPPRSIFCDPPPANLITVRCCAQCHEKLSKGDELLKLLVVSGKYRSPEIKIKAPSVRRAIDRNPWWNSDLLKALTNKRQIIIESEEGPVSGSIIEFSGEARLAIVESIRRIAIGLIFHKDPSLDFTSVSAEVLFAPDENPSNFFLELKKMEPLQYTVELENGSFLAKWSFATDSNMHGVMYLSFYGGVNCVIFFTEN